MKTINSTVALLMCGFGIIFVARSCSDTLAARRKQATPEQLYATGKAMGEAWVKSPLFDQKAIADDAFMRGFFAGMNTTLEHIEFQTNSPHMVLELTNVLADLERIHQSNNVVIADLQRQLMQQSNAALRAVALTNK